MLLLIASVSAYVSLCYGVFNESFSFIAVQTIIYDVRINIIYNNIFLQILMLSIGNFLRRKHRIYFNILKLTFKGTIMFDSQDVFV